MPRVADPGKVNVAQLIVDTRGRGGAMELRKTRARP